jgi:eukaryotic-like serine/threonine-protein kinase
VALLQSPRIETPVTKSTPSVSCPVDPDLEIGRHVGEYVVEGPLGRGAFGAVYRAVHPLIGKRVAIKVLARKFSVDPEMVSRFQAEARAVNQIRHRNIIDIFSFQTLADGRHYYVMEYLEGETLDALLEREGRLSLARALPILRGLGRALDAAHAAGIAHRDLKAENVFLAIDPDGDPEHPYWPKLLDFGIAKLLAPEDNPSHRTRTGTFVGTPYYMSPEQCRGADVDHRTDLYAFGVLAYRVLAGVFPHDADDYLSILMRQTTVEPDPPSSIVSLPAGVDEVIAKLLAKDPAARPPDLRTAIAALEAVARDAGLAIPADPSGATRAVASAASRSASAASPPTGLAPASRSASRSWASAPTVQPGALATVPHRRQRRSTILAGVALVAALGLAIGVLVARPWRAGDTAPPPELAPVPARIVAPEPAPEPAPARIPTPVSVEEQTVIVTIAGVPEGTEVLVGGLTAGAAPGPVQLPREASPLVLTFKRDGYLPTSRTVTPDRDQSLTVTLKQKPQRRPTRDDIIDVFGRSP